MVQTRGQMIRVVSNNFIWRIRYPSIICMQHKMIPEVLAWEDKRHIQHPKNLSACRCHVWVLSDLGASHRMWSISSDICRPGKLRKRMMDLQRRNRHVTWSMQLPKIVTNCFTCFQDSVQNIDPSVMTNLQNRGMKILQLSRSLGTWCSSIIQLQSAGYGDY